MVQLNAQRRQRRAFVSTLLSLVFILAVVMLPGLADAKKKKKGGPGGGGMQGSPFGQNKVQMVFITIRDEFAPEDQEGMEIMTRNYKAMMQTGGLTVGTAATSQNQMVAIANTIKELIELRKFALSQEEVLSIEYDSNKFVGNYVTDEEREKHNLPAREEKKGKDDYDDEL